MGVKIKARAKLNLTLNIEGMYDQTYHSLSSVITTVDVFDIVEISPRNDNSVSVKVNGEIDTLNVANGVAQAICRQYGVGGVDICVDKGVAVMGGMGGSSVDAAATIMGMSLLYSLPFDSQLTTLAAQYGSDIAYMLKGGLALATGKGDDIKFVNSENVLYFTVINGPRLRTPDVFAEYDRLPDYTRHDNSALLSALSENNISLARTHLGNNLEAAAARLSDKVSEIFLACEKLNLPTPAMTGSGGNFFILHKNLHEAQKAAAKLSEVGLSAFATLSADSGIEQI